MQFIENGPDLPDGLLEAHEEGKVVFFCGAGISYPAGLPDFQGLVDQIYLALGTKRRPDEEQSYSRKQYDATLDLLERRIPGERLAVRTELVKVLRPKLRRKGAKDTHRALLELARSRDGALRLVTTNFDRIFWLVAGKSIEEYSAPLLPIPKKSRWNGLVYLHGLAPDRPNESALNRLVLTSGDFGLAYLTERWAARFVSELFRNYIVCFVGYSINDPVLRYMMDALAADRMLGQAMPQGYAFGDYQLLQEETKKAEWQAKGVVPILYQVPAGTSDHSALHKTLHEWARTYRDGTQGKERIVVEYAMTRPSASTQQDDFVGRMLWAMSHQSGLPAQRFAEHDPVPSLDWLDAFEYQRYRHGDLGRFGVPPFQQVDDQLSFALVRRPTPYNRAPWMALVSGGTAHSQLDHVMWQIARWLLRHLNDPKLIWWLAQHGGQLHDRFIWLVESRLGDLSKLQQQGNTAEIDRIVNNAPNAIPNRFMRILWRLLLSGRIKSSWHDFDLYRWAERLKRDGYTTTCRFELRDLLAPRVAMKKPFHWNADESTGPGAQRLRQLVDWELVLLADHVHSTLAQLDRLEAWRSALPSMVEDVQQLLRDAVELICELEDGDPRHDRSHWDLPSIEPHRQNRGFRDWIALIEILRDAWLAVWENDKVRAREIAKSWLREPYATFKRLALFSASHGGVASSGEWVDWLLDDSAWWLWSAETRREAMRLLVLQGADLSAVRRSQLEAVILAGPPRAMFSEDLPDEKFTQYGKEMIWLRLAKLREAGAELGTEAQTIFASLSDSLGWHRATDERDEFSHWMSGTGDPDFESLRVVEVAPRKWRDLRIWLEKPPADDFFHTDDWRQLCSERFYQCVYALCELGRANRWPVARWREALQAWSEEKMLVRSWTWVAPLVDIMPDEVMLEVAHGVTWWLEATSKSSKRHEDIFFRLTGRLLSLNHADGVETDEPVTRAINHPIGHVTRALLNFWFRQELMDGEGLPEILKRQFTQLCDTDVQQYLHGRVLLASQLIPLFRVDRKWSEQQLLPLFNWHKSITEARAVWEGFLWSPRLYRPLLSALKESLLDTAKHYADIGEHKRQFAGFLTYAALDPADTFTIDELRAAFDDLPQEGLQDAAQALVQALEGAGEQRERYWADRVHPFWKTVWPKARQLASPEIAEQLARLTIAARSEFPAARTAVQDWLMPLEHPDYAVHLLKESDLCRRFPKECLLLLDAIIEHQPWGASELKECLTVIAQEWPPAVQDRRYQRLLEYARLHSL